MAGLLRGAFAIHPRVQPLVQIVLRIGGIGSWCGFVKTILRLNTFVCGLALLGVGLTTVRAQEAPPIYLLPAHGMESTQRPRLCDVVPGNRVDDGFREVLAVALEKVAAKSTERPCGLSVAVLVPGSGYWTAQFGVDGHNGLVTEYTRFHAASASKLVTAALVAESAVAGQLDLAARLEAYLGDLPSQWRNIPLGTLLNHTSGLGSFDESPVYDRTLGYAPGQLLDLTPAQLQFASGKAHRYSNTGYLLLGLALEKSSSRSWEDQVSTRFFDSIADCRALVVTDCNENDIAVGHIAGRAVPFLADYKNTYSCGGIVSSALDLARIYDSILNARLISATAAEILCQEQVRVQDSAVSVWAGRGINRVKTPRGSYLLHRGSIPGFTTLAGVSLETGVTVVVMANDTNLVIDDYFFGLNIAVSDFIPKSNATSVVPAADSTDDVIPFIYREPANDKVAIGFEARFTVGADFARNYRWQRQNADGNSWTDLVDDSVYRGTRSDTLRVRASLSLDRERYRCVVSNDAGSVTTRTAMLDVTRPWHGGGGAISPFSFLLLGLIGLIRWMHTRRLRR